MSAQEPGRASGLGVAPVAVLLVWQRSFPAVAGQVGEARRALARWLDGHPAAGDAALCLSELAANAVLHSASARPGGTFRVLATAQPARLRVEVADDGGTWRPDRGPGDHSGRGLMIVSSLADGWGICATPQARTVWFELSSS